MLNDLDCPAIPELANDYKQLMAEWRGKGYTSDFDIQICEVACKHKACIEDFRWRPEPTPPAEYSKYLSLNFKDRDILLDQNPNFFKLGKVATYFDARDMIINKNKINFETLKIWSRLDISDNARELVERNLNTYSGRM